MYVNGVQKFFTYAGHYTSECARESVRIVERLMRHMPKDPRDRSSYWHEMMERSQRIAMLICLIPMTFMLALPSLGCYTIASLIYDPKQVKVYDPHLKQLRSKGELLSDHSAMIATFGTT
jgi:hypothetical protein